MATFADIQTALATLTTTVQGVVTANSGSISAADGDTILAAINSANSALAAVIPAPPAPPAA